MNTSQSVCEDMYARTVRENYFGFDVGKNKMSSKDGDFFEHPRYRLNKLLMSYNGQWPYQAKCMKIFFNAITWGFSFTALPAQFAQVIVHRDDPSVAIPALGPIIVHIACMVKLFNSMVNSDKVRVLLDRIRDDWQTPMGQELTLLTRFADDGRKYTLIYAVWIYVSMSVVFVMSTVSRVLWLKGWANFSEPPEYIIPIHFTDHDEEYYVFLQIYLCVGIQVTISSGVAVDGMFVVYTQHACGIFAMVGRHRLEHMVDDEDLDIDLYPDIMSDKTFWIVVDCIEKHKKAIEFAMLVDATHSSSFLLMLGCNMLSISVTALQMLWGANPDSVPDCLQEGLFIACLILHLWFECLLSQRLTDYSLEVYNSITRSKWYQTSLRTRRLLNFMLIKSMIPWELKAGKVFTMSMASFSAVLRTSLSYLTILSSID